MSGRGGEGHFRALAHPVSFVGTVKELSLGDSRMCRISVPWLSRSFDSTLLHSAKPLALFPEMDAQITGINNDPWQCLIFVHFTVSTDSIGAKDG